MNFPTGSRGSGAQPLRIVFQGEGTKPFLLHAAAFLPVEAEIAVLSDQLSKSDRAVYGAADVIVSGRYQREVPASDTLKLFQVPGAGYDAVDLAAVPAGAYVCNSFGHEIPISEYVMSAILLHQVPIAAWDVKLRAGDWSRGAGWPATRAEAAGKVVGLLGYGHIGKAIAARAKAFGMTVIVANRSAVEPSPLVDRALRLDQLNEFWPAIDYVVDSLPLTPETAGIVGESAFAAMRPNAVLINVGRGPTIDEESLFRALKTKRIAGAVIDTWYQYPKSNELTFPSRLPFHELENVIMTPHMSAWSPGTVSRRQKVLVDNVAAVCAGTTPMHIVRGPRG